MGKKIKINEVFPSIQGEGFWVGTPTLFIRLSGCNLACSFCDTEHDDYKEYTLRGLHLHIKNKLAGTAIRHFCITGGEPTIHPELFDLVQMLEEYFPRFTVQIETNGTNPLPERTKLWVTCSPKTILPEERYKELSELKFLIGWTHPIILEEFLKKHRKHFAGNIYVQPMWGFSEKINQARVEACYSLCLEHNLRLSLQIHKLVGGIK